MQLSIHFLDKTLILTDTPVDIAEYRRLPSSELSRANILKIFETTNTVVVLDSMIEAYAEQFFGEFKYVEAAGGLVENERGESLMINCYNRWDLPKGHVDAGESDEECAVREIGEETGVKNAKIVRFLCNTYHAYSVYGGWELKRTAWYQLRAKNCPTTPQVEESISQAKWCTPEEVAENMQNTYQTIKNVFKTRALFED